MQISHLHLSDEQMRTVFPFANPSLTVFLAKYSLLDPSISLPILTLEYPEATHSSRSRTPSSGVWVKAPPTGQSSVAPYAGVGHGTCGAELLTCRNHVHRSVCVD
jgi:hypothetical protein